MKGEGKAGDDKGKGFKLSNQEQKNVEGSIAVDIFFNTTSNLSTVLILPLNRHDI